MLVCIVLSTVEHPLYIIQQTGAILTCFCQFALANPDIASFVIIVDGCLPKRDILLYLCAHAFVLSCYHQHRTLGVSESLNFTRFLALKLDV